MSAHLYAIQSEPPSTDHLVELLSRVAERDRQAFTILYQATSLKLYGIVFRILKRRHLAEDILQDCYVKIWQRADDFDSSRGSAIAWMVTIARNRALDEVRRRPQIISSESVAGFNDIVSLEENADSAIQRDEEGRKLWHCLEGLEQDKRAMIILAYQEGCSREVLSQRFDKPVATVKTWLRRSLQALKECLGHD